MAKKARQPKQEEMTQAELQQEQASEMPDRENMSLLDLDANLDLALDLAAPIDAAVAANANVAVPLNASVAANVIGIGSTAYSAAGQDSIVMQDMDAEANATATQTATIDQGDDMSDSTTG
jgi:hypothetical protein